MEATQQKKYKKMLSGAIRMSDEQFLEYERSHIAQQEQLHREIEQMLAEYTPSEKKNSIIPCD